MDCDGPAWRKSSHSAACGDCAEVAAWRTSTASAGTNCAEVGAWRKSSHSDANGTCAEVGQDGAGSPGVAIQDTKDRQGAMLVFSTGAWTGFVTRVRSGEVPAQ